MIVAFCVGEPAQDTEAPNDIPVARKALAPGEPIPPDTVWIDMLNPTEAEDRQVENYLGFRIPTRADTDYTEPSEAHYSENGVRYLRCSVISEPEETPDITGSPSSSHRTTS
jgi:magnesium transporter